MLDVDKKIILSVKISLTHSIFNSSAVVNHHFKIAYFKCSLSKVSPKLN